MHMMTKHSIFQECLQVCQLTNKNVAITNENGCNQWVNGSASINLF